MAKLIVNGFSFLFNRSHLPFYFSRLIVFYVFISALFVSVLSNDIFNDLSKELIAVIIFSFHIFETFI